MRLALYAHYSTSGGVALYVLFYLRKLRELGFRICFISNSPIPESKGPELHESCEKVIRRENSGYDFGMWQQALEEYDLAEIDELLLTNSSIIGPLHPLEPLWQNPVIRDCDFWGLTDNDEFGHHLQTYFIVLRRRSLQHPCFREFWRAVLPFTDKEPIILSYEVGLTRWLDQHDLNWKALFPRKEIHALLLKRRSLAARLRNRIYPRDLPWNTSLYMPDLLLESGMPFLKANVLIDWKSPDRRVSPQSAMRLLEASDLPADILSELRLNVDASWRE